MRRITLKVADESELLYWHPEECSFEESGLDDGENYWSAEALYRAAKEQKCKVYQLPLKHYDQTANRYALVKNVADLAYHVKRCLLCDMRKPVLFGPYGSVVDGYHRLTMAIATGAKSIPAMRLKQMPPPTRKSNG